MVASQVALSGSIRGCGGNGRIGQGADRLPGSGGVGAGDGFGEHAGNSRISGALSRNDLVTVNLPDRLAVGALGSADGLREGFVGKRLIGEGLHHSDVFPLRPFLGLQSVAIGFPVADGPTAQGAC
jgi:hypothetical protein